MPASLHVVLGSNAAIAADAGQSSPVAPGTRMIVVAATLAAFVAAAFAARRARKQANDESLPIQDDLLGLDLLDIPPSASREAPVVATFEKVLLATLFLYALFDRAFAWFHVPGTPLFVGELVLAFGILAMTSTRIALSHALRLSAPLKLLAIWMGWGLAFLALQAPIYGLDAVRDSAIWYYASVAFLTMFLLVSDPSRFGRWIGFFTKAIPYLLVWFPIAMVLTTIVDTGPPYVPDSTISIFYHKFGNIAVVSGSILGFLWLVDRERSELSTAQRFVYTTLASLSIIVVGFQNRGGMLAAFLGIVLMVLFMRGRRAELVLSVGAVVIALAAIALITDVRVPIYGDREISAAQMMDNIGSVINPDSGGSRQQSTTQWRLELWTAVIDDVVTDRPVGGFGPGPDLGARYGVTTDPENPLRNPHNSHLGVMARMGLVGFGLWALLWVMWFFQLLLVRSRLLEQGRRVEAGIAAWLAITAFMILINAIFDPTLEGPQVAFWLWAVFGVGVALTLIYAGIDPGLRAYEVTDDAPVRGRGTDIASGV